MVSTAGECSGTVAGREASATTLFKGFTFTSLVATLSPSPFRSREAAQPIQGRARLPHRRDLKTERRLAALLWWSPPIEVVNRSELGRGGQTHLVAASAALDAIPEHDALVAVLVTAEGAPQTPQNQNSALLLPGPMLASLAGNECQTTRDGEAATGDRGIDEHSVAENVQEVDHATRCRARRGAALRDGSPRSTRAAMRAMSRRWPGTSNEPEPQTFFFLRVGI